MDSVLYLFLNIAVVGALGVLAIKLTEYDMAWWLRVQRSTSVVKKFLDSNVVLEIRLPRDVFKNPSAMEIIMNALNQGLGHEADNLWDVWKKNTEAKDDGHGHKEKPPLWKAVVAVRKKFYQKYLGGGIRMWHSLEIVSIEGQIKFFVVTQKKNAEIFKSYAYSQYPGIEVLEVEDYIKNYTYYSKDGKTNMYIGRYKMADNDALPIKTYIDYGLDKDPKEEYKIDPLTPLLEAMASAQAGESFFYQILIRPTIFKDEWVVDTKKKIDEILGIKRFSKDGKDKDGNDVKKGDIEVQRKQMVQLSPAEKDKVEALEKNLTKPAFDTIVRVIYHVQDPLKFDLNRGVFTVVNAMKSFNKPGYGTFEFVTATVQGDHYFMDPTGGLTESNRSYAWFQYVMRFGFYQESGLMEGEFWHLWFTEYRRRIKVGKNREWAENARGEIKEFYLHPGEYPHKGDNNSFIVNLEELVTLWHFPGKAFGNTSGRVESVKSDAPRNLPI